MREPPTSTALLHGPPVELGPPAARALAPLRAARRPAPWAPQPAQCVRAPPRRRPRGARALPTSAPKGSTPRRPGNAQGRAARRPPLIHLPCFLTRAPPAGPHLPDRRASPGPARAYCVHPTKAPPPRGGARPLPPPPHAAPPAPACAPDPTPTRRARRVPTHRANRHPTTTARPAPTPGRPRLCMLCTLAATSTTHARPSPRHP
jgi:hypothetical protein